MQVPPARVPFEALHIHVPCLPFELDGSRAGIPLIHERRKQHRSIAYLCALSPLRNSWVLSGHFVDWTVACRNAMQCVCLKRCPSICFVSPSKQLGPERAFLISVDCIAVSRRQLSLQ